MHTFAPDGDYRNQRPVVHEGVHSAEVYANACIAFLEAHAGSGSPFYAYVAFQTPHDPRQAPEEFQAMYPVEETALPEAFMPEHPFDNGMLRIRDEQLAPFPRTEEAIRRQVADYHAVISHTDAQIGRILEVLERTSQLDNTIIVFSSDNGLALGRHGLMGKQNVYEHSIRVPLVIAGPGVPVGEVREQLCYLFDIYPTLCEMAALDVPETVEFESLVPSLRDGGHPGRSHLSFAFMSWQRAVRDDQFKLIEYAVEGRRSTQLFDLLDDPHELTNLAGQPEFAETLARMRTLLATERVRLGDGTGPFAFTRAQGEEFWETFESTPDPVFP